MKMAKQVLVVVFLLFGMRSGATYADFQAGLDAANRGDYATALREWKPLAEQGNASAQYNLGLMYCKGEGVLQDWEEAAKLYRLAAEQGFAEAQTALGLMYYNGYGVLQDWEESARWYEKAAEQGYAVAQGNVGLMYRKGQGVLQDDMKAHMWWNIAASAGDKDAAKNRGLVEDEMTSEQIVEAQKMARECVTNNLKGC